MVGDCARHSFYFKDDIIKKAPRPGRDAFQKDPHSILSNTKTARGSTTFSYADTCEMG